jgi:hypothetical protein
MYVGFPLFYLMAVELKSPTAVTRNKEKLNNKNIILKNWVYGT